MSLQGITPAGVTTVLLDVLGLLGGFRGKTTLIPLITRPKEAFLFRGGLFFSRQNHKT